MELISKEPCAYFTRPNVEYIVAKIQTLEKCQNYNVLLQMKFV